MPIFFSGERGRAPRSHPCHEESPAAAAQTRFRASPSPASTGRFAASPIKQSGGAASNCHKARAPGDTRKTILTAAPAPSSEAQGESTPASACCQTEGKGTPASACRQTETSRATTGAQAKTGPTSAETQAFCVGQVARKTKQPSFVQLKCSIQ